MRGGAWLEGRGLAGGEGPVGGGGAWLEGRDLAGGAGPGWREVPVRDSGPALQEMASGLPTAAASAVNCVLC